MLPHARHRKDEFTYPSQIKSKITELVGEYPVDVKNFRTDRKDWLRDEIFAMSRKQWQVVKWLLTEQEWDYFHFVDIGLDRVHHGFWNYFDKKHVQYEPGNPYQNVIPDYYLWLDEQIGSVIELLDSETVLLLVSDHGAQRLDGGIAVNQWLINEGLLVLDEYPTEVTPFNKLKVNWAKTKVWSEGGYYARVFFNVQGREPQGVIPAAEYDAFQNQIKAKFEAMLNDKGKPLNSLVFKPKEIYHNVRNVAPDLIVHFGGLDWRSIGTVGYPNIYVQENDTGPDGCNHAQYGMFRPGRAQLPDQRRIRRRKAPRHRSDFARSGRIRDSRIHARALAGRRHGETRPRRRHRRGQRKDHPRPPGGAGLRLAFRCHPVRIVIPSGSQMRFAHREPARNLLLLTFRKNPSPPV